MVKKYYAVKQGRKKGIYETWEECEKQVKGFSNQMYKAFETLKEAEDYMSQPTIEEPTTIEEPAMEETNSIESDSWEQVGKGPYKKGGIYNEIGADETGKEFYGPMVACAVYYDGEFEQDIFDQVRILDSKIYNDKNELEKVAKKLMDPENKLKFTIVEAIGDYTNLEQEYEYDTRWDYKELYEHTNNMNASQAFMINQAIQQSIDKFGEPTGITYDSFGPDSQYYNYLKGTGNNMSGKSITDLDPNSRIIENIKSTKEADGVRNSPSAAAAIIAKYVRNQFFDFVNKKYPVTDENENPIEMPQSDTDPAQNIKYGLLFIDEYGRETFDKFTKYKKKPYDEIIKKAEEKGII